MAIQQTFRKSVNRIKSSKALAAASFASIILTSFCIGNIATPAHASQQIDETTESKTNAKQETLTRIHFKHPLDPEKFFEKAAAEDIKIRTIELSVGDNAGGLYGYDPTLTAKQNASALQSDIKESGGEYSVATSAQIAKSDTANSKKRSEPAVEANSTEDDIARGSFNELPEKRSDNTHLPAVGVRANQEGNSSSKTAEKAAAKPVAAETEAHPNSVTFKTDDNVSGKRKLTVDATWKGDNSARKNPKDWGFEISLYQWNYNMSSTIVRPACPASTDDRFWADARMHSVTIVYMYNDGVKFKSDSSIEPYLDTNHWSDPCSQGALGFGIGRPDKIPYWGLNVPEMRWNQKLSAVMYLKKGKNSWSHISASSKFVKDNCAGEPASTDCMGTGGTWPKDEMGGGSSDMILLNKSRKWKTPTFFGWDAEAVKRPAGLKR